MRSPQPRDQRVYAWIGGQQENIGDAALRRSYADFLRSSGSLRLFVDDAPDSYLDGLRLGATDLVTRSERTWLRRLMTDARRGRVSVIAFDAGEIQFARWYFLILIRRSVAVMIGRRYAIPVVHLGIGVRAAEKRWARPVQALLRLADHVAWRNEYSRDATGFGEVMPDWAFGEAVPAVSGDRGRDQFAISLRGDIEAPDSRWYEMVRAVAEATGLRPVAVVQVRRDSARNAELAANLGCDIVDWPPERSVSDQEVEVRAAYRRCTAVISDRLHALIMGITEGAVPIASSNGPTVKMARHLDHLIGRPVDTRGSTASATEEAALVSHLIASEDVGLIHREAQADLHRVLDGLLPRSAAGAP